MRLGLSVKLDVSKIQKERLFKGEKGVYLDLTSFIDLDNPDEYGQHGFIAQSVTKEEREAGVQTPILGNVKVFYREDGQGVASEPVVEEAAPDFDDSIPF